MLIFLGIILILAGIAGIAVSTMAFGDIGVAICWFVNDALQV